MEQNSVKTARSCPLPLQQKDPHPTTTLIRSIWPSYFRLFCQELSYWSSSLLWLFTQFARTVFHSDKAGQPSSCMQDEGPQVGKNMKAPNQDTGPHRLQALAEGGLFIPNTPPAPITAHDRTWLCISDEIQFYCYDLKQVMSKIFCTPTALTLYWTLAIRYSINFLLIYVDCNNTPLNAL